MHLAEIPLEINSIKLTKRCAIIVLFGSFALKVPVFIAHLYRALDFVEHSHSY